MKRLFKLVFGCIVVLFLAWLVLSAVSSCVKLSVVDAIEQATGSEAIGALAASVLEGTDLTDSEIMDAFGIDESTLAQIESAAQSIGIDIHDSSQLADVARQNIGNLDEITSALNDFNAGTLSSSELADELRDVVVIP